MNGLVSWIMEREPRERVVLAVLGLVSVLLLLYALVWLPVARSHAGLLDTVAGQRDTLAWMLDASARVRGMRTGGGGDAAGLGGRSLLAVVDRSARGAGLGPALKRVEPEGDNSVRVWMEGAEFDRMVGWLEELAGRYGVGVRLLSIERDDAEGLVGARVTLEGASG